MVPAAPDGGYITCIYNNVKVGCTTYWKLFPVKKTRDVYISIVNSMLNLCMGLIITIIILIINNDN